MALTAYEEELELPEVIEGRLQCFNGLSQFAKIHSSLVTF
jgi:hypothetical protein